MRPTPLQDFQVTPVEQDFSAERFASLLAGSPLRQHYRWWKAHRNPLYDSTSNTIDEWVRVEQEVPATSMVIARGFTATRRLFPFGELRDGDISITYNPQEAPISNNDWILLTGSESGNLSTQNSAIGREAKQNEVILAGGTERRLTGIASSTGSAITFSDGQSIKVGDILKSVGQSLVVTAVSNSTHCTVTPAPSPALNQNEVTLCYESLTIPFATYIEGIWSQDYEYRPERDFSGRASDRIEWLPSGSRPSTGTRLSVSYYYHPLFMSQESLGVKRATVDGKQMISTIVCRQVSAVDYRSQNIG